MPLYPGLLALFLLAPGWAPAQSAPPVAVVVTAAATPANLQRNPDLASEFDRGLLLDAGYLIERDGSILDKGRKPLDEPTLKTVLETLRARRKEKTLADLEAVQEEFGKSGGLTPGQSERLQAALRSGWPLIPEDVRAGFNEMLAHDGGSQVYGPKLDWVERAAKSWDKAVPGDDPSAKSLDAYADRGVAPGFLPTAVPRSATSFWSGAYKDEFSPPPAAVVKARLAEVDKATWRDPKTGDLKPYADNVKAALREVMRYADARDGEAALAVLREVHPPIAIGNDAVPPFAAGVAHFPDSETPRDEVRIGVHESLIGYQMDPKTGNFKILPDGDPAYYKKLGIAAPKLAAFDPAAKPESASDRPYYRDELFPDGSVRRIFKAEGLAPTLLHELMHIDTHRIGAGAQSFSNEMRSMTAERRLMYNRDEAHGLTKDRGYGADWDWYARPLDFRRGILASYSSKEIGEIRPGEESVEGQIENKRALLAGGDLTAWRTDSLDHGVDRERDNDLGVLKALQENGLADKLDAEQAALRVSAAAEETRKKRLAEPADASALLKTEMSRLEKDREQTLKVFLEDWRWHRERGIGAYTPEPPAKEGSPAP